METVRMTQVFLLRVTVETPVIGLLWRSPQTEPSTAWSGRLQTVSRALSDPDSEDTVNRHSCRASSVSCVETRIMSASLVAAPEFEPQMWHLPLLDKEPDNEPFTATYRQKSQTAPMRLCSRRQPNMSLKLMSHLFNLDNKKVDWWHICICATKKSFLCVSRVTFTSLKQKCLRQAVV